MRFRYTAGGAAIAALVLIAAAPPAQAIVHVTYKGVVSQGSDLGGLFGPEHGTLDGKTFTARFQLDDSNPHVSHYNPPLSSSYDWSSLDGGASSISVTIDHHSFLFDTADSLNPGSINHNNSSGAGGLWGVDSNGGVFDVDSSGPVTIFFQTLNLFLNSATDPFVTSFDYHKAFTHDLQPGDNAGGHLSITEVRNYAEPDQFFAQNVSADLVPLSVSVAIPEPATWASMILGFGLMGAAMRRRRPAIAHARG